MKVGSIIECIATFYTSRVVSNVPIKGQAYTIRDIIQIDSKTGLRLEEVVNKKVLFSGTIELAEPLFEIEWFRELQLPDDIEEILKQELQLK